MALWKRKQRPDLGALPGTLHEALLRMENDSAGAVRADSYAQFAYDNIVPVLQSSERIDLAAPCTFVIGHDQGPSGRELRDGLVVTGDDHAYFCWAGGGVASVLPYSGIEGVDTVTAGFADGQVPGFFVNSERRWLLLFPTDECGPRAQGLLHARLAGGIAPMWEE